MEKKPDFAIAPSEIDLVRYSQKLLLYQNTERDPCAKVLGPAQFRRVSQSTRNERAFDAQLALLAASDAGGVALAGRR
jgi:hypothetical protein